MEKDKEIIATISPAKERQTLQVSELKEFFATLPKLTDQEMADFAADINKAKGQLFSVTNKWQ